MAASLGCFSVQFVFTTGLAQTKKKKNKKETKTVKKAAKKRSQVGGEGAVACPEGVGATNIVFGS